MINKFSYHQKHQINLIPLVGGFLGLFLGISGVSNQLILEQSENVIKNKLGAAPREVITLSFAGFRTLFLTYVGISAGSVISNRCSSRNKSQQKN